MSVYKSGAIIGEYNKIVKREESRYTIMYTPSRVIKDDWKKSVAEISRFRSEWRFIIIYYESVSIEIVPEEKTKSLVGGERTFFEYRFMGLAFG